MKQILALAAIGAALIHQNLQSETLPTVPMQGGMMHVEIQYAANDGGSFDIHAHSGMHPMLVPLSVSHPGDTFDPAHPWAVELNPTGQASQFNRQFGFMMAATSDLLPANHSVHIKRISSDPGLRFHEYRPNQSVWNPILGTDGSSDTLAWNMAMFHPSVSYSGTANMATATFAAILVDGAGVPIEGMEEQFTLMWTVVKPLSTSAPVIANGDAVIPFELPAPWAGRNCKVWRTTDFETWFEVGTVNVAPAGANSVTDTDPPAARAFYSIEVETTPAS